MGIKRPALVGVERGWGWGRGVENHPLVNKKQIRF